MGMRIKTGLHNLSPAITSQKIPIIVLVILIGLYALSTINYLIYHTIVEFTRVLVGFIFFVNVWRRRRDIDNDYLVIIALTLPMISILVVFHTLAFKGMNVLADYNTDLPTQLWIAERYIFCLAILVAPCFLERAERTGKRLNPYAALSVLTALITLILLSLFYWRIFPSCYVDGRGLTLFKILSEFFIIIGIFFAIRMLESQR